MSVAKVGIITVIVLLVRSKRLCSFTAHAVAQLCHNNYVSVSSDPHACVLHIPGLQAASAPKVPRWEDFHFSTF